jgi:hypothetical protein
MGAGVRHASWAAARHMARRPSAAHTTYDAPSATAGPNVPEEIRMTVYTILADTEYDPGANFRVLHVAQGASAGAITAGHQRRTLDDLNLQANTDRVAAAFRWSGRQYSDGRLEQYGVVEQHHGTSRRRTFAA